MTLARGYVLYMFMSAALASHHSVRDPAMRGRAAGGLLGLVRALVDYGRDLVATLQARAPLTPPLAVVRRFGGVSVALIIARITRGLMIAAALEQRLLHPRPRQVRLAEAERAAAASPRGPRAPRRPQPDEEAELLGALPSAKEIAARIRNKRTGAVIAEICRDLGITAQHPLWRQINDAIILNGGNTVTVMRVWWRRSEQAADLPLPPEIEARFDQLMAAYAQPP